MKTAEEFLKENYKVKVGVTIEEVMIEFAKYHVEKSLEQASVEAEVEHELSNPYDPNSEYQIVNKESILNAYPLENIV